ncbi:MAG: BamA/TamA family outer membrane protein [Bdellovibrionales bacterium]|nr:BamA/TamA family outer membrane protein [Bdellovibrionales bacterium]
MMCSVLIRKIVLVLGCVLQSFWAQASSLSVHYDLKVQMLDPKSRTLEIEQISTIENHGNKEHSQLTWLVYPNRFQKPLPHLGDLNYHRIYPHGFSKGEIVFSHISVPGQKSADLKDSFSTISFLNMPKGIAYTQRLDKTLKPQESITVKMNYKLIIPNKLGSFGFYRDILTLSGGWTPYLASLNQNEEFDLRAPPEKSSWNINIDSAWPFVIKHKYYPKGQHHIEMKEVSQVNMQSSPRFFSYQTTHAGRTVEVFYPKKKNRKIQKNMEIFLLEFLRYVEKNSQLFAQSPHRLSLSQAPLREMLAVQTSGSSYFSDRTFKTVEFLRSFHTFPLLQTLFGQLVYDKTHRLESNLDALWVTELLAQKLTQEFIAYQKYQHTDARDIQAIKTLSIFPIVDQVIHSPQFAFFDVFYDFAYPYDPVRDDFLRFNHRRAYGRSMMSNMEDVVGEELVEKTIYQYLVSSEKNFMRLLQEHEDDDLGKSFSQWIAPRPPINYKLSFRNTEKKDGQLFHQVSLIKEGPKDFVEPVELRVKTKGKDQLLIWDGEGSTHEFEFQSTYPIKLLEIDPRRRLLETDLSDNRKPAKRKFVLTESYFNYDVVAEQPQIFIAGQLRKTHGGANRFNVRATYLKDIYGVNFSYLRLFGSSLDHIRLSHGISAGISINRIADDFALVDAGSGPTAVQIGQEGWITSVTSSYLYGNQVSFTNPLEGGYGSVSLNLGTTILGGDSNYYRISTHHAWILPLHPNHFLAFRGQFGTSGQSGVPSQVQFRLGGIDAMRGLPLDDNRFTGRHLLLLTGEYRHFLYQDFDVNFWLFRVRSIQGALFSNAGRVTHTTEEKALHLIDSTSSVSGLADLFRPDQMLVDVGYGLRFHIEYFGVSPSLLTFDIARSISDLGTGLQFYLGVTQTF